MDLARLTTRRLTQLVSAGESLCLLPVGATEQHGPHLPLATDTLLAEAFCSAASERTGVPVLPALAVSASRAHTTKWAGTLALSPMLLVQIVLDVAGWVRSAGFDKLLLVNSHVGNVAALGVAVDELRDRATIRAGCVDWFTLTPEIAAAVTADATDWHANAAETSLLMHLRPELIDMAAVADDPDRTDGLVFSYTVAETSANGVTGAPTTANATAGAELFEAVVCALTDTIRRARDETAPEITADPTATGSFLTIS